MPLDDPERLRPGIAGRDPAVRADHQGNGGDVSGAGRGLADNAALVDYGAEAVDLDIGLDDGSRQAATLFVGHDIGGNDAIAVAREDLQHLLEALHFDDVVL